MTTRFDYARTVALSDGVFAIALTLLVLSIQIPTLPPGHDLGSELWSNHRQEFLSYAISFAVIARFWVIHHRFFGEIKHVNGRITVLNLTYLGFIALVPYPTELLGRYGDHTAAPVFYAVTIALIALLSGAMGWVAQRDGLLTEAGLKAAQGATLRVLILTGVFIVSIPVAFVDTTAAELCWVALLLAGRVAPRR